MTFDVFVLLSKGVSPRDETPINHMEAKISTQGIKSKSSILYRTVGSCTMFVNVIVR